ncbi:MAG: ABC transporter ATP-binding protein [Chlamydiales bacterium]|nr:ABC transporter ATP-binding protein [Chlamydiales bacterium]
MKKEAIVCKSIKKAYGEGENRIEALRGIDMAIDEERLALLVGPSGSGKTTLLSVITTILTPDEGSLFLFGQEPLKMHSDEKAFFCQKTLGIVFQSLFLVPTLTVLENVTLPLLIAGCKQQEAIERAMSILKKMHLDGRANTLATLLSKGQQQRVAIARALVNDAKIIICDEPTSALDHVAGNEVMALLKNLVEEAAKTVLVVTHDHRIFSFADQIIKMDDGQIIYE